MNHLKSILGIGILVLLGLSLADAQVKLVKACPEPTKAMIVSMCNQIIIQKEILDLESPYEYVIEQYMETAACVDRKIDSAVDRNAKIRLMWTKYEDTMVCDGDYFSAVNASMLTFAAFRKFEDFLLLGAEEWKVPLNKVDSEGRTVLDFIHQELTLNPKGSYAPNLSYYYKFLKEAGAVHKKYKPNSNVPKS